MSIFEILKKYCTIEDMPYFAIDQGMVGLLYDEVKHMNECPFEEEGFAQIVMYAEKLKKDWTNQKNNINTLANLCRKNNLKMLVFKGYAMSLLYDRPESRKMGDVDVFFFNADENCCAGDLVDDVARSLGEKITPGWKHTTFEVRDTHVENHRHFVGWDEHKNLKAVEGFLLDEINGDKLMSSEEWPEVYYPSPNFNAVLLAVHMGEHFVYEGACLRHLVDWAVFLDKCGTQVDWDAVYALADKCGYRQWLDVLNAIAIDYFGIQRDKVSLNTGLSSSTETKMLEEKVMKELAESKPFDRDAREHHFWKYLFERTHMAIHDRWKLRMVYDENPLTWYLRHAWRYATDNSGS